MHSSTLKAELDGCRKTLPVGSPEVVYWVRRALTPSTVLPPSSYEWYGPVNE